VVRWGGTAIGVAYVVHLIDVPSLKSAFAHASVATLVAALAVIAFGQALGAVRWRILMRAYGARTQPSLLQAIRLYFVAVFYNTYLPGGVAGDILRGVVTRKSFRDRGSTEAIAVVLVERALGLLGVVTLAAAGLALAGSKLSDTGSLWIWSAVGGVGAVAAVLTLPLGRRLSPYLPGRLGDIASRLPVVSRPSDFFLAMLLSLFTQLTTAVAGWLFLRDFHPTTFADALFIVPLAAATAFLPITIGGTGAREAVFIVLSRQLLGMSNADALAASLLLWLTTLIAGALGGLWQLIGGELQVERAEPRGDAERGDGGGG
jgi:glycosyltransferase 2 family protein